MWAALTFLFLLAGTRPHAGAADGDAPEWTKPDFEPLAHCATPPDTFLGVADGVPAFSNCHRHYSAIRFSSVGAASPLDIRDENGEENFSPRTNILSAEWVALNFVERYLVWHKGVMLHCFESASKCWDASPMFSNPHDSNRKYNAIRIRNAVGASSAQVRKRQRPWRYDIVLWNEDLSKHCKFGHYAIVTRVEEDVEAAGGAEKLKQLKKQHSQPLKVYIAEQNWDNLPWHDRNYTRILSFAWNEEGKGVLTDPSGFAIAGRLRVGKRLQESESPGDDFDEDL